MSGHIFSSALAHDQDHGDDDKIVGQAMQWGMQMISNPRESVDCKEKAEILTLSLHKFKCQDSVRLVVEWHWYAKKLIVNHHQPSGLLLYSPWYHKTSIIKSTVVHCAGAGYT